MNLFFIFKPIYILYLDNFKHICFIVVKYEKSFVMDAETRKKRVEGLEAIKTKALDMASQGADSLEVRDFITDAKTSLAYELPDREAFGKAVKATLAYKKKEKK